MATMTPTNLYIESAGSLKRHVAIFGTTASTVASGDSWASAIPGIIHINATQLSVLNTDTNYGIAVTWTASNGTIIVRTSGETSTNLALDILSKS